MRLKYIVAITVFLAANAHAVVITNMSDLLIWQSANESKPSAKHDLSADLSKPILQYTRAKGPIKVSTRYAKKIDEKCAVIAVTYDIANTLTTTGKYLSYTQTALAFGCVDGSQPSIQPNLASMSVLMDQITQKDIQSFIEGSK